MIGDPANLIMVEWSVIGDDGPDAYVLEFTDGQLSVTYGPMPREVVGAFLAQRKTAVGEIFDRIVRRLTSENSSQEHQQVADQALP